MTGDRQDIVQGDLFKFSPSTGEAWTEPSLLDQQEAVSADSVSTARTAGTTATTCRAHARQIAP